MKKIFCIGLNKTGTTSLHEAFNILGLNSVHYIDGSGNNIKNIIQENYELERDILNGIDQYDAYSDWDIISTSHIIFKEFDRQYPGSKFILNTRDLSGWLDSREKHVISNQKRKRKNPELPITWLDVDRAGWELQYKRHHAEILSYFKVREKDLLVFDVTKGDGWEKLCPFLELPFPSENFPKKNIAPAKNDLVKKIIKKTLSIFPRQ